MTPYDLDSLHAALIRRPGFEDIGRDALRPLPRRGIAHDHFEIRGTGALLRVPRLSQLGLPARENLEYQMAGFLRAAAGDHAPRPHGACPPSDALPMGAAIVDFIEGDLPRLPRDLPAIAECLASIHRLPTPGLQYRPPLAHHADPVAGTLRIVEEQAKYLPAATGDADALAMIGEEIEWARGFAAESAGKPQPVTLVATDTHPGNYIVRPDGRAFIVDLEKALYGSPAIDLAHATLHTSTVWDIDIGTEIGTADIADFYRHYRGSVPSALARDLLPWLMPMRRLTWLRTTTWAAKWRVGSKDRPAPADARDAALAAHVETRSRDFLSAATVERVRNEWRRPGGLAALV